MMETKTAIVMGATSGIGEAIARAIVAKGSNVMLAGRRTERLRDTVEELGPKARFTATDVTVRAHVFALIQETERVFGQVDFLVNNAGLMPLSLFASLKVDE